MTSKTGDYGRARNSTCFGTSSATCTFRGADYLIVFILPIRAANYWPLKPIDIQFYIYKFCIWLMIKRMRLVVK